MFSKGARPQGGETGSSGGIRTSLKHMRSLVPHRAPEGGMASVMGVSLVTGNQPLCHTQADANEVAQSCLLPPPTVEHGAWPGKTNLEIGRWDTRVRRGLEIGL